MSLRSHSFIQRYISNSTIMHLYRLSVLLLIGNGLKESNPIWTDVTFLIKTQFLMVIILLTFQVMLICPSLDSWISAVNCELLLFSFKLLIRSLNSSPFEQIISSFSRLAPHPSSSSKLIVSPRPLSTLLESFWMSGLGVSFEFVVFFRFEALKWVQLLSN